MSDLSGRFATRLAAAPFTLLGMVHVLPLPGSARWGGSLGSVVDHAVHDARVLAGAGFDGLVVENFGDVPFVPHASSPETVAAMAVVVSAVRDAVPTGLLVGVNLLRNDAAGAMAVAVATGADLIRVNVHVGSAWTDQGLIHGRAHDTLRQRLRLGCPVAIVADVLVKHAHPVAEADPMALARDAVQRGLADGLVVTGPATGTVVDTIRLRRTVEAAGGRPVLAGSGTTPEAVAELHAAGARGAIVGTWCKVGGRIEAPVDADRASRLVVARDALSATVG